jgi:endonuclease/exonuclease/phosphatase family metal-dependent hydrolase
MNAVSHRFVAALSGTPGATWMAATGTEQPGEAAYGIALLSRYPARSWNVIRLPNVAAPFPMWLSEPRKWVLVHEEPRVCVSACLDSPDGPITVANTHLSFVPGWNRWQLRRLRKAFTGIAEPLVLLGDLNMETDKAVSATGYRPLATLATFPKHQPSRQLDHALARGTGFDSVTCSAPELAISDHRALVVDVVHRSV